VRILACLCVAAVVAAALVFGGCGGENFGLCVGEGGTCEVSSDCCDGALCFGPGTFTCHHPALTVVPRAP
jgi:hypothetical protein